MASCRIRAGDYASARDLLNNALKASSEAEDRILMGRVLNNEGLLYYWEEDYEAALQSFRSALEIREGIGYSAGVVINHHNIGDVHFSRGDFSRAYVAFTRSRELADEMHWERGMVLNELYLGYIHAVRRHGQRPRRRRTGLRAGRRRDHHPLRLRGSSHDDAGRSAGPAGNTREQAERYGLRTLLPLIEALADDLAEASESSSPSSTRSTDSGGRTLG